ncbi:uncharacterized protein TNCV_3230971 [Trichonephila clavipes]|nr:uncharacterized protein TNCV_3230971 [Trichonephila clavipes]
MKTTFGSHLEDNIRRVIADIRPQMLEKVIENWTSRLDYIRASRGSPMPEIIFKMSSSRLNLDFNIEFVDKLFPLLHYMCPPNYKMVHFPLENYLAMHVTVLINEYTIISCRSTGIVVSDAGCGAEGMRSNPGEDMDVCKCIVPLRHGGTLNSRRAASPLVRLAEGEEMWEPPDHPRVFSLKIRAKPC